MESNDFLPVHKHKEKHYRDTKCEKRSESSTSNYIYSFVGDICAYFYDSFIQRF